MKEKPAQKEQPFRPEAMDLSKMSMEELTELKNAIMARASEKVGPEGFNPIMMDTNGMVDDYYSQLSRPWEYLIQIINMAFRRIALAVTTAGLGITTASLYSVEAAAGYAPVALIATGISAGWFIVDMVRTGVKPVAK